jgi:hypothetical protein
MDVRGDAGAFAFGGIGLVTAAGRDVIATAAGDVEGTFTAGRDLGLRTTVR